MMSWSYVGLLAALVAEIVSRLPGLPFAASVWVSSLLMVAAGGAVLKTRLPATLRRMSASANAHREAPHKPARRRDKYVPKPEQPDGRTRR
jgi:hypothetical protein